MEEEPAFAKVIGIDKFPSLVSFSDSAIMSMYMDCIYMLGADAQQMVLSTVLGYDAKV